MIHKSILIIFEIVRPVRLERGECLFSFDRMMMFVAPKWKNCCQINLSRIMIDQLSSMFISFSSSEISTRLMFHFVRISHRFPLECGSFFMPSIFSMIVVISIIELFILRCPSHRSVTREMFREYRYEKFEINFEIFYFRCFNVYRLNWDL